MFTMEKAEILSGLTREQKKAVTHGEGPLLVVAGAGTGKTMVITRRIAWLVAEKKAKPEEILALTFTEKAAAEMTSRVDDISEYVYGGLQISTFHSFGSDIISDFSFELGLPSDYKILTDVEQVLFIRDHIFDFEFAHFQSLSDPTSLIGELVKLFSRLKDENIDPQDYQKKLILELKGAKFPEEKEEAEKNLELAKAFVTYNRLLRENGYIDYGDQINLVIDLLKKPSVAKKIREKYKYVLVDEFQDTNYAQNVLLTELFGRVGNITVVGDDDQSIYRFRGSSISNILNFKEDYKNVEIVVLTKNFRSTQSILDGAYKLIQNNNPERLEFKYKIDKKLTSVLGAGSEPKLNLFETESQEAEFIAETIKDMIKNGTPASEIAVLFRANSHAGEIIRTLRKHGIPFVFSGATGLYERLEVKILVSLVNILTDPEDDLALYHLALSDVYDFNPNELASISTWAKNHNRSLSEVFSGLDPLSAQLSLGQKTVQKAEKIIADLSALRNEAKESTAGEIINLFLRESGYYGKLTRKAKEGSVEAHNKISNIAAFFDKIIHFQRNYKDHSLKKFAEYLSLVLEAGDDPKPFEVSEGLDAVNILSVHKAKGLEFETVFLASLSDSHFPGRGRSDKFSVPKEFLHDKLPESQANIAEERRLFYVAMTRAKKALYLSAALDYGTKKTHKISRFILELFGSQKLEKRFLKTESIEKIKHFEKVGSLYNIVLKPIPETEKVVLSRAAIDDFLTCPFKYQLIHVTPIRIIADATVAYGNTIHNTIGEYYKRRLSGRDVKLTEFLELYDLFWDETGFLSKTHERKRYECGREALKKFYEKAQKMILPKAIEKDFRIVIGNSIIKGRYDAIFETETGTEIYDFKTSNVKKQEEADDRTKKSTQLATYSLSWKEITGKLPSTVHLYFVDTGIIGNHIPTEKEAVETKKEIEKVLEGIRKREYGATPGLYICKYCPFKFYCPEAILEKVKS